VRFQRVDPAGAGGLVDVDGEVPAGVPVYVHGNGFRFIIEQDPMTGNVTLDWQWGTISVMRPHGDGAKLLPIPRPDPGHIIASGEDWTRGQALHVLTGCPSCQTWRPQAQAWLDRHPDPTTTL
jgi:hypothetical protein